MFFRIFCFEACDLKNNAMKFDVNCNASNILYNIEGSFLESIRILLRVLILILIPLCNLLL